MKSDNDNDFSLFPNKGAVNDDGMLIALDYDDTITLDPTFWKSFITATFRSGHRLVIVTARYKDEGNLDMQDVLGPYAKWVQIIYTGRKPKKPFCEGMDIHPDVWIDDRPDGINTSIWDTAGTFPA